MNVKWLAFGIFVWFIAMIMGSYYEEQFIDTYAVNIVDMSAGSTNMTVSSTFGYLFDFSKGEKETSVGNVMWKLAQPDYYASWFGVLTFDFKFLKDYDSGTGEFSETLQSYFFKALGIIGLLCFILMFIDVIQGFIPSS